MRIPIDRESRTPLYRQIVEFLKTEIETGALAATTRLPSTRELADSIGVNRITVNNAYAELEAEGLIYSRLGSGTFVAAGFENPQRVLEDRADASRWPLWQTRLAGQNRFTTQVTSRQPAVEGADWILFSEGVGSGDLFPIDDFRKAIQTVLSHDRKDTLSYGDRAGYLPLRATISHILADQGILSRPENILITSGSQQALWLVMNMLLRPGDTVLVESPTYSGTLNLLRALDANIIGVPVDQEGMQVDQVEDLLRTAHPSLIYTIPTFQNPTGTCLSSMRRRQLIALSGRYNVPILEDEFVGDLRYEGHSQPALKSLDPDGRVIYISTFSKMLMPGLRVGYIAANGPVYDQLLTWKGLNDLATSNLIQRALEAYITVGRYQSHLHRACRVYRRSRDLMISALSRWMPADVRWYTPSGGLFIWAQLPAGFRADDLLPYAAEEMVDFAPGRLFFPDNQPSGHMRLNFAGVSPDRIEEGIARLARAVKRLLEAGQPVKEALTVAQTAGRSSGKTGPALRRTTPFAS